jgi:uncharacterized membrane protein
VSDGPSAQVRVLVATGAGLAAGAAIAVAGATVAAPMAGWDVAALVYVGWVWVTILHLSPPDTARLATREDPGRRGAEVLVLAASVASLAAVTLVLVRVGQVTSLREAGSVGTSLASVVLSWVVVHTVYTLRYADIYYTGPDGGIDFNQDDGPCYTDFAYVAFTIGMTFQVSDTSFTSRAMRATALRHALLSYLFGSVILATTINLVAGLSRAG